MTFLKHTLLLSWGMVVGMAYCIPRMLQVNQTLIEVYMSINQSVLATIQRAEVMIDVAQEKNTTPFIDSALEQLKKATTELNNAMKRVRGKYFNTMYHIINHDS